MQLSAELVHQKQEKQVLNTQVQKLKTVLADREKSIKLLSENLCTRESELIFTKKQRNKLRKTINQLEEQFMKFAKH